MHAKRSVVIQVKGVRGIGRSYLLMTGYEKGRVASVAAAHSVPEAADARNRFVRSGKFFSKQSLKKFKVK